MVHLYPYLNYKIESLKTSEDIYYILKSASKKKVNGINSIDSIFIGEIYSTSFEFIRNISYRNSFQPVIRGNIKSENDKTIIEINMRLHSAVLVFSIIWFGAVFYFFLIGLLYLLATGFREWHLLVQSAVMAVMGQFTLRCAFYIPAKKDIEKLEEMLK